MQTTFIYGLECPITKEIKYIGKSNNPKNRVKQHLYETTRQKNYNTHKIKWFEFLKKNKIKPNLVILDEVNLNEWGFWELWWLQVCRTWGFEMVNILEGGDGCSKHSLETIEKIRQSQIGEKNPMFGKPGVMGMLGKTLSEKSKKKISEANKGKLVGGKNPMYGKTHSLEVRKKISEANIGRKIIKGPMSEEQKNKIRNSVILYNKNKKPLSY